MRCLHSQLWWHLKPFSSLYQTISVTKTPLRSLMSTKWISRNNKSMNSFLLIKKRNGKIMCIRLFIWKKKNKLITNVKQLLYTLLENNIFDLPSRKVKKKVIERLVVGHAKSLKLIIYFWIFWFLSEKSWKVLVLVLNADFDRIYLFSWNFHLVTKINCDIFMNIFNLLKFLYIQACYKMLEKARIVFH